MRFLKQQFTLATFVFLCHIASGERWSRQLTPHTQAVNDWVPISQEAKSGKSIKFSDDLVPAAQTQFQFFTEPLNNRFNLQQSHPAHPAHPAAAPSEVNSFIQNSPPQFQFLNPGIPQQQKQRTVQTFGGPINKPIAEPLIQNPPNFQFMQEIQRTPQVHHYQTQPIPKTHQNFNQHQPVPAFQNIIQPGQSRIPHFQKLPNPQFQPIAQNQPGQQLVQESEQPVQLLYVPFNSLYSQNNQQPQQTSFFGNDNKNRFNILNQPPSASLINDFYSQNEVNELPPLTKKPVTTTTRRPTIAPATASYKLTTPFETTSKLKPHQPPLSMFVANDKIKGKASQSDVLNTLKSSNKIDVMDSVRENSPKVFIGPSGMSAPDGYSKFELPYLSNIDGTRNERKIDQLPFFVAPLSYKTPPGFSKIPLPAPHVGSIVVNQPNSIENNESNGFTQDSYYTKQPQIISSNLNNINHNVNTNNFNNEPPKKNTQTVKLTSGFHLGSNGNVQLFSNEFTFPTLSPSTTQQPKIINTTPKPSFIHSSITPSTPLTKVKASIVQEHYSTFNPTTIRTPAVTRSRYEEFDNTKSQFYTSPKSTTSRPSTLSGFSELDEHKTVNEEYFKVNRGSPSISPSFEYEFESKQQKPKKDFNFKPIPEFNFDSVTTTKKPKTKPTTSSTSRITTTSTTYRQPTTIKYREPTVIIDKSHKSIDYSFPSTPLPITPSFEYTPTVSIIENTDTFRQTHGSDFFTEFRSTPRPTLQNYLVDIDELNRHKYNGDGHVTDTHKYIQENQSLKNHDFFLQGENIPATESPSYNLPSELPPINAKLPGLINSLMDDKWMQVNNITDEEIISTTTTSTTTTRRPTQTRGRRPVSSTAYRTVSSTAEPNYERKQVTRGRRPSTYASRNTVSVTEPTFTSRSTPVRSSKIKYNITSEDQSRFRTRNRRPVQKKEEDNIEYQRDILNQNYPSSVRPPVASQTISTERAVESVHIHSDAPIEQHIVNDYNAPVESVEVIPLSGNKNHEYINNYNNNDNSYNAEPQYTPDNPLYFENIIETTQASPSTKTSTSPIPITTTTTQYKLIKNNRYSANEPEFAIPQHKTVSHRLKGNYNFNRNIDSFYNVKSQDTATTQATEIVKDTREDDELIFSAVPSTTASTSTSTTEAPVETEAPVTRRTNFPRRRLYTTTTEPATDATESYGSRNKQGRKENVLVVKKVVRTRGRTTTTTTEVPETTRRSSSSTAARNRVTYTSRNVNRERNPPNYENNNEDNRPRFRIRENTQRFRLDTQESQWSSRFNQNSFQPIDEEKSKSFHNQDVDDNQEIVTANPNAENESYLVNVSASVLPSKTVESDDDSLNMVSTTEREDDLAKRTKNVDDLDTSLDKLMKDVIDDIEKDTKSDKKSTKLEKKGGRRGVWRKVKVRPADGFETAETQNIGKHLYNSVANADKVEGEKTKITEEVATTFPSKLAETETTIRPTSGDNIITTVLPEQTFVEDSKTRMFDDARKAFVEFLSTEDDADDAVNMEEADEKLEKDRTTTTQIPTTDDSITTTSLPQTTSSTFEFETSKPKLVKEKKQIRTSTSQKVTGEICFRGKCIKTDEK